MNNFDIIGIGFGPANISLAAYIEDSKDKNKCIFLEKRKNFTWQEEMLFENALDIYSNIQNIPYRDLATPRDPKSRYTFMNYLFENKRLFSHLNMDMLMPMRPEYADYIKWCGDKLSYLTKTNTFVSNVTYDHTHCKFILTTNKGDEYSSNHLVLGTGRDIKVPLLFKKYIGDLVFHFTFFKSKIIQAISNGAKKIAIIGSSQTAAELLLYLTKEYPELEVDIIMRRFAFPLKDTSPFMSEIYFPSFTNLFSNANDELKNRINKDVYRTNYAAADMDVIEELYRQIYHDTFHGRNKITMHRLSDINDVNITNNKVNITIQNHMKSKIYVKKYDSVVLATGFLNYGSKKDEIPIPYMLKPIKNILTLQNNAIVVNSDYSIQTNVKNKIFLNGLSEYTHGMGDAGSLSLASIRAKTILDTINNL